MYFTVLGLPSRRILRSMLFKYFYSRENQYSFAYQRISTRNHSPYKTGASHGQLGDGLFP